MTLMSRYLHGLNKQTLSSVTMTSAPMKRLYKELPVWIVEDHHDVSLASL